MTPHTVYRAPTLIALVLMAVLAGAALAGDGEFQSSSGSNFFSASPACPVKQFPTFESLAPVPGVIDPFEDDFIPLFCHVLATKEGKGVKKAKGHYETELIVRDNNTGVTEVFPIGSGKFSTDKSGRSDFDFDLPAELFADGFESGDISAWSYTRTTFTNNKKADSASTSCASSSSSSSP